MEPATRHPTLIQVVLGDIRTWQFVRLAVLTGLPGLLLLLALTATLVGWLLLLTAWIFTALAFLRVRSFRAILEHGDEVPGQIDSSSRTLFASRGRYGHQVEYIYRYGDTDYRRSCRVASPSLQPLAQPGDQVTVLVYREQPQDSLVPILYRE